MGTCSSSKVEESNPKQDMRRYSNRPSPLTEEDIKSRIVASEQTEIMKGIRGENGCTFDISYAYLSQRGYYPHALSKANQDAFCSHAHFNGEKNTGFWGVFDGHGGAGDHVSHFSKSTLPRQLVEQMIAKKAKEFGDLSDQDLQAVHHTAFVETNKDAHKAPFDSELSGTTAITVMVKVSFGRGKTLILSFFFVFIVIVVVIVVVFVVVIVVVIVVVVAAAVVVSDSSVHLDVPSRIHSIVLLLLTTSTPN